jgi:hypothetical protein
MADTTTALSDPPRQLPRGILVFVGLQLAVLLVPRITLTPFGLGVAIPAPWLAEVVLLLLLVESLLLDNRSGRTVLAGGTTLLAVGGVAYGGWLATERLWLATLVLVLAGALLAYGLHRYQRVSLELVASDTT